MQAILLEVAMRPFLSLLAAGLLIAGCVGTGSGGTGGNVSPSASASLRHYNLATGSNDLIIRLTDGGGLAPLSYLLTHLPGFSLYGDGRIVVPGPVDTKYPGPLLPNLRVLRITPEEIQRIVAAADEAGLLGPDAHYDATNIYDAGTSVFTLIVDGKTHTVSAYALFEGGTVEDEATAAARARLMTFRGRIEALSDLLGHQVTDEDYELTGMRVYVGKADETADPSGLTRQVVDWPLAIDPGTAGEQTTHVGLRCLALSGTDLTAFLAVARTANQLTIWRASGGRYSVMVRPLLPDESGCGIL
jgi:hypothetical protein